MGLSLEKKQTLSLSKDGGSTLKNVTLGLGWDPVKGGFLSRLTGGNEIDLDATCVVLDANKQPLDMVWFRQLQSQDGSIQHSGDNRTGEGDGDDETIRVALDRLPSSVKYLVFTVNSFTGQTFEKVQNAYCRILDTDSRKELGKFNLSERGAHTGIVMAYIARNGSSWDFTTIGQNTSRAGSLEDLVRQAVLALPQ